VGFHPPRSRRRRCGSRLNTERGSSSGHDFHWFGPAKEFLERLRKVPSGGGVKAVRSEFS